MATEFWISQPKLHKIGHNSDHTHHTLIFFWYNSVFVVGDFKFVKEVFKGRCRGDQTMNLLHKFGKDSSRMYCIFNIFASAGGLGIGDFRYVSEVYKGCFHGNLILDFIAKNAQNWP